MLPRDRVETALRELGLETEIFEYAGTTRTAQDAAAVIGCETGQVVKTLVFLADGRPTIVLVPGDRVAKPAELARLLGVPRKRLKMATANEVREHTGYEVGTVAPVGLPKSYDVIADRALQRYRDVWASAGSERAMFRASQDELMEAIGAQWADITEIAAAASDRGSRA